MNRFPDLLAQGRAKGVALVAATAVGQAIAAGVAAFATRDVFAAFATPQTTLPIGALVLIVVAGVVIAALRVIERTLGEGLGQDYAAALRKTLFIHLSRMPAREVSRHRSGALALRFVGDLAAVRSWVSAGVTRMISAAIVLPGALLALVLLNPQLALAAAGPLLLSVVLMALLAPRLRPLHQRLRRQRARLAADMSERIPAAPELRLIGRIGKEVKRLERNAGSLRQAAIARTRSAALLRVVPDCGAALAGVLLLATAYTVHAPSAEAAAALAILGIVALPLRDLANIWDRRRAWEVARDKCNTVLNASVLETVVGAPIQGATGPAGLAFDQVSAGALSGIQASVAPGEIIAIVGGNGAGKSTLLSLAAGLEHAESGCVVFNDADIRALSPAERSKRIAYIGPRSPILKGSLRRALTLGIKPRPADGAIDSAARKFGLGNVIDRLGGLNGHLSEGGRNLSSGEARRIHLVRALLARPQLLLLDEPDDALDVDGRELIRQLMRVTRATTLIITHDLALARHSHQLWYIQGGNLCEHGSPGSVLKGDGPTARFFRLSQVA
ncbi:MAG: ABC transporter ATP-binding protein [Candidatus Competibacteraceae bacterium]|jgi:ATP-binding cassette subfamily B protein/ATP-binding cassette subfamily C protein CydC|nr:ABC transporter ATP-binding protein [Candidatus Competibacteraceae bacterium]